MLGHPSVQWVCMDGASSCPASFLFQGWVRKAWEGTSIALCKIAEKPAVVECCSLLHGLELIFSALEQEGLQLFGVHSYLLSLSV